MTTLGTMDPTARRHFDRLCSLAKGRSGLGLTLDEIADAGALARELAKPDPDRERVEELADRLELEPHELRGSA